MTEYISFLLDYLLEYIKLGSNSQGSTGKLPFTSLHGQWLSSVLAGSPTIEPRVLYPVLTKKMYINILGLIGYMYYLVTQRNLTSLEKKVPFKFITKHPNKGVIIAQFDNIYCIV